MSSFLVPLALKIQSSNRIQNLLKVKFNTDKTSVLEIYNLIWANPDSVSPQDVISSLGTNAEVIFNLIGIHLTHIGNQATTGGVSLGSFPTTAIKSGWTITFNLDGSANVTAPA